MLKQRNKQTNTISQTYQVQDEKNFPRISGYALNLGVGLLSREQWKKYISRKRCVYQKKGSQICKRGTLQEISGHTTYLFILVNCLLREKKEV